MATNFSDDVHFLRAFHLKFTADVNFVSFPVETIFSTSIVCPIIIMVNIFNQNGISLCLLCPDSDPS